jgi:serine/threonine protein kinase
MGPNEEDGASSLTEKTPASTSDGMNLSRETPPAEKLTLSATSGNEVPQSTVQVQPTFKQELIRMKEMQGRVELPPDEVEEMKNKEVKLLDDGDIGIGFKSFDVLEILGNGAFGKVFKCKRKGHE